MPLPLEDAWTLMLDVPRIMPCLPGAKLTEVIGDNKYRGSVAVKLGPIKLAFEGQAELVRQDAVNHIAYLQGSGLDPKGRGSAQSDFSFALTPAAGGGTDVQVTTKLQLAGAVAQYGRGSGMIAEVASHILKQFEQNLADSLQGPQGSPSMPFTTGQPAPSGHASLAQGVAGTAAESFNTGRPASPGATAPAGAALPGYSVESHTLLLQSQALLGQSQAVLAAAQQALLQLNAGQGNQTPPQRAQPELNMLSIGLKALWNRIKHGVATLFGKRN